jgi:hypothetical protein
MPCLLCPWERDTVPIIQEAGWDPGPIQTDAENLASLGFDPRTFQHAASRYADYNVMAHKSSCSTSINQALAFMQISLTVPHRSFYKGNPQYRSKSEAFHDNS